MCHSVLLGEQIKRAVPHIRVMMNQRAATPAVQLLFYQQTIALLETRRYDFAGAVSTLRNALLERLI
jgi:hypothetical protein